MHHEIEESFICHEPSVDQRKRQYKATKLVTQRGRTNCQYNLKKCEINCVPGYYNDTPGEAYQRTYM